MSNNTKEFYGTETTKVSVPNSEALDPSDGAGSPTVTAALNSNQFTLSEATTNVVKGAWLVDTTNDKVYKVDKMISDTVGQIVGTFDNVQSAAALTVVTERNSQIVELFIAADYGNDSELNGDALKAGTALNRSVVGLNGEVGARFLAPVIVDGSVGQITYSYTLY